MTKAVFFDVDGTLLSFKTHQIPASTLSAIEALKARGIKIFISTGRPKFLLEATRNIEFHGYITLNGSLCLSADDQVISKEPIPKNEILRILEWSKHNPHPLVFMHGHGWAITHINDDVRNVTTQLKVTLPEVTPLDEIAEMEVFQIMGFFPPEKDEYFQTDVLSGCEVTRWHPLFTDIVKQNISKREGMYHILEHYGIEPEASMAFGDGGNDITILGAAAIGIAMGNASDEVKQAADYITASVDEEGIAKALLHFGLI
ncbi:MAG: Cof-type HAD-IIB family hydrolase [Bacteroidales bacterium]